MVRFLLSPLNSYARFLGLDDTLLSHASLLKYVLQKWAPEGVIQLGERVKYANSLPVMQVPRDDQFPPYLDDVVVSNTESGA